MQSLPGRVTAESLNQGCACRTLDPALLQRQLECEPALAGLYGDIARTRPHLFSPTAVFISTRHREQMAALVAAVEDMVQMPAYRQQVLAQAPAIAGPDPGPRGVFMGFDFHLGPQGARLIEINTNAGGALLNVALARAQHACCREMEWALGHTEESQAGQDFMAMFAAEWHRQRGDQPLQRIALVDDDPAGQYLYPEFQLFVHLCAQAGIEAVIADAQELTWQGGRLWHAGKGIDMVYNRLTDFYLQQDGHEALREAYQAGAVVLTPHPHAHALYANKRNLALLSDPARLEAWQVSAATREVLLNAIPATVCVLPEQAGHLWQQRRHLFFKPASGYGSKAAYRGDKLTRRVWETILAGDYVAQALIPPSERRVQIDGAVAELKLDVRAYAYAGRVQLLAARLYAGQTTNFRTDGGGFSPVFVVPEAGV